MSRIHTHYTTFVSPCLQVETILQLRHAVFCFAPFMSDEKIFSASEHRVGLGSSSEKAPTNDRNGGIHQES
jgi:hypothetical protein